MHLKVYTQQQCQLLSAVHKADFGASILINLNSKFKQLLSEVHDVHMT